MYSPYKISLNEEQGFYYFFTQNNIEYRCFFTQSESGNNSIISLDLDSNVYYFDLVRYTKCDKVQFDRHVSATVGHVLNTFFDKNPNTIISYICDNSDLKGEKRQFSFSKWLKVFNREPKKALIKGSVLDTFFAGAVLLKSHPEKDKIHKYFESELEILERETSKYGDVVLISE